MKRYCLTVDLIDDPQLIEEYEFRHRTENAWPEIMKSIKDAGIVNMEIYRISTRLFMIMETTDEFSFADKAAADENNPKVQEWEELMWKYQKALPIARPGEKWILMNKIFQL